MNHRGTGEEGLVVATTKEMTTWVIEKIEVKVSESSCFLRMNKRHLSNAHVLNAVDSTVATSLRNGAEARRTHDL